MFARPSSPLHHHYHIGARWYWRIFTTRRLRRLLGVLSGSWPCPVAWRRNKGESERRSFGYGHTWYKVPDPIRTRKSNYHGRRQYCGGGPRGNTTCRNLFFVCFSVLLPSLFCLSVVALSSSAASAFPLSDSLFFFKPMAFKRNRTLVFWWLSS